MEERAWNWSWALIGKIAVCAFVLLFVGLAILELALPGAVVCPALRLAKKMRIDVDEVSLDTPTADIHPELWEIAKEWKSDALEHHPNLRMPGDSVVPEGSGISGLEELNALEPKLTQPLREALSDIKKFNPENGDALLSENEIWTQHVEQIAAAANASTGEFQKSEKASAEMFMLRKATRTMHIKACIAAHAKNETEALRCMRASKNLNLYLHHIKHPDAITLLLQLAYDTDRRRFIVNRVLPELGPSANLDTWLDELKLTNADASRLAEAMRGEWSTNFESLSVGLLMLHQERRLIDPEATAMAYSKIVSKTIMSSQGASLEELMKVPNEGSHTKSLSPEGQELIDEIIYVHRALRKKIVEAQRDQALHQAAIEILMLEARQGTLNATDSNRVVHDPLTHQAFPFDPDKRTLQGAHSIRREPLKLPW